jgi:hypothetical protein
MATQSTQHKGYLSRLRSGFKLPVWSTQSYETISEKGDSPHQESELRSERLEKDIYSRKRSIYRYLISGAIFLFLILPIPIFLVDRAQYKWKTCGTDPITARQRGCSFDLITFAWQLPKCYDRYLVEEFAAREPWKFYTSEHGNETVSLEEARKGEAHLWLTWRYHKTHCAFVWRQQHRAYETGWIDEHARTYRHTIHCQNMLLSDCYDEGRVCRLPNDTIITEADMIYPACERVDRRAQKRWDGFSDQYS